MRTTCALVLRRTQRIWWISSVRRFWNHSRNIISWMMPRDIWPLRSIVSVLKISAFLKMAFILAYIHCCQTLKKQGRSIALATSKPEVYARRILDKYELMPYFDVVVGSKMDGRRTDKGEVITEALRQLQVADGQRQEVLMIGDRLHDMIGAGKNHVDKLGVYYGYAHEGELEEAGADYTVCTVEELYDFFKAH